MFATKLGIEKFSELVKKVQGNRAVYAKIGYGIPLVGTLMKIEKTMLNIIISEKGCRIAQAAPKIDWL